MERRRRPAPGGRRAVQQRGRRRRRAPVRPGGGAGDRRARRGAQLSGQSGVDGGLMIDLSGMRRRHRRPGAQAGPGGRRGLDLRPRRRHPGARPRRARRGRRPHGDRRPDARRRHGLADPAGGLTIDNLESVEVVVADGRVLRASRRREPGPVLGGPRRRRQLRRRHGVRVPAARGRPDGAVRRSCSGRPSGAARRCAPSARPSRRCRGRAASDRRVPDAPPAPFVPAEHHVQPGFALDGRAASATRRSTPTRSTGCAQRCRRCSRSSRRCRTRRCSRCSTRPTRGASPTTRRPRGAPS